MASSLSNLFTSAYYLLLVILIRVYLLFGWTLHHPKLNIRYVLINPGRLCTISWLSHLGIIPPAQSLCPRCGSFNEAISHLFLHCESSWLIWAWFLKWWGVSLCIQVQFPCCCVNGNLWQLVNFNVSFGLLHFLLFFGLFGYQEMIRFFIIRIRPLLTYAPYLIVVWMKAIDLSFSYMVVNLLISCGTIKCWSNSIFVPRQSIQWMKSSSNWIKWNIDGSALGKPSPLAIGGVLHDSNGTFLCIFFMSYIYILLKLC